MIHLKFRHDILILHIACTISLVISFVLAYFSTTYTEIQSDEGGIKTKATTPLSISIPPPPSLANKIHPEVVWVRHSRVQEGFTPCIYFC